MSEKAGLMPKREYGVRNGLIVVDMHCHSGHSDGTMTPEQVAKTLFHAGVQYAALTDHDTLAGLPAFHNALMRYGIGFITGVELTAIHKDYIVHILAYGFDPDFPGLCVNPPSDRLSPPDAYEVTASRRFRTVSDVIGVIHSAGGVAILAHPVQTEPDDGRLAVLIDELKKIGLDGIEAVYGPNPPFIQTKLLELADERDLIVSAGTDFHGQKDAVPGIRIETPRWKAFRDAFINVSASEVFEEIPSSPKRRLKKPKNQWVSFVLKFVLPAVLSLGLFVFASFAIFLPYFGQTLTDQKRENIREMTQVAWGVLYEANEEVQAGSLSFAEAQTLALSRIEDMRYGADLKDYFWVQDLTPHILMHPYRPDLDGQDVSGFEDSEGKRIFVEFANLAQTQGEGYISYYWQWQDNPERIEPKESYIRLFEPWGWVIGTGIYVNDVQTEIANLRTYLVQVSLGIIAIVLVLLVYLVRQSLLLDRSRYRAEKLLRESVKRYRALSEAATEGALFVYDGRCRYANAVMYELMGCTLTALELLDIDDVFPDIEENRPLREHLLKNETNRADMVGNEIKGVLKCCDGRRLACICSIRYDSTLTSGFMILVRRAGGNAWNAGKDTELSRLLQLPAGIASNLTDAVSRATTAEEAVQTCRQTPELAKPLLENGTSSITIASLISSVLDATTKKLVDLTVEEMGPPPAPFAFLAIGSHGRQSLTLQSDQDNALVYKLSENDDPMEVEKYFLALAEKVCDLLEGAGYKKCIGNNVASNPRWCRPLYVWKSYFEEWITRATPQHIVDFNIFFDFRPVAGESALAVELRGFMNNLIHENPFFLTLIAQNALTFKTQMRLFGNIVPSGGKEHPGRIDVKTPAMAIISFARLYALQQDSHETNTFLQLESIKRHGVILDSKQRSLVTIYETLLRLRLQNQASSSKEDQNADKWIDPDMLGRFEEAILTESFKEIDELQSVIQRDFLGGAYYSE